MKAMIKFPIDNPCPASRLAADLDHAITETDAAELLDEIAESPCEDKDN